MKLTYLGINGLQLESGGTVLLVDPYVSRAVNEAEDVCSPERVHRYLPRADYIVLGHSHYDHAGDLRALVEYGSPVILGSETTLNICRSYGAPEERLRLFRHRETIVFGPFSVTPLRSLHKPTVNSGAYTIVPQPPRKRKEFPEGGTWALKIESNGRTLVNVGSANLIEESLAGEKCDLLVASVAGRSPQFFSDLLSCIRCKQLMPSHWDDYKGNPLNPALEKTSLADFEKEIGTIDPTLSIRILQPLESIEL